MRKLFALPALAAFLVAAALLPVAAEASTITSTFSFTATGAGGGPQNPVTGSFTITYDPTLSKTNDTAGIQVNSLSIALGTLISYDFNPATGAMIIGGTLHGAGAVELGTDDFFLGLHALTDHSGSVDFFSYSQVGESLFSPSNVTLTFPVVASTPIPAGLPLLATCLAALGFCAFLRARRSRVASSRMVVAV